MKRIRLPKWILAAIALLMATSACLAAFEAACLIRVYFTHRRDREAQGFVRPYMDKFHLAVLIKRLTRSSSVEKGGRTDIGDLDPSSDDAWKDFLVADGLLGWRNAPNVHLTHYRKYAYSTNAQGFMSIGDESLQIPVKKPADVFRVFVLGGSTVMGQGAPTPAHNIVAYISRALRRKRPDLRFEIINAGVGGYRSCQEYLYLATEIVHYDPDLVIVYDGWNDMAYNNLEIRRQGTNFLKAQYQLLQDKRLNDTYTVKGSLLIFFASLRGWAQRFIRGLAIADQLSSLGLMRISINVPGTQPGDLYNFHGESVRRYQDNLESMIDLAFRRGFRLALFLQPVMGIDGKTAALEERYSESHISDLPVRTAFYKGARAVFRRLQTAGRLEQSLCVSDLSQAFSGSKESVYVDSGHLNPDGNEHVAGLIVNSLQYCGLLPRRGNTN